MSKIIQPNTDFDIRLKMIHDECTIEIDQYVQIFLKDRTKTNYDLLKEKVFNYLKKHKILKHLLPRN